MGEISLQVGLDSSDDSQIKLKEELFKDASIDSLFATYGNVTGADVTKVAQMCVGYDATANDFSGDASAMLENIDAVINQISDRVTTLGAAQNRIESAIESIGVQSENITSSLSTLRDADIAEESSNYIQAQILQQAAATLLSTANQTPSIALNLL
jgi:flagellin-like hook-associated protein FlgL